MAHHNESRNPSGKKRGKRGSVRNDRRLDALAQRRMGEKADWGGASPERIQAVIVNATVLGGAVTFGTSRDGGAYSVTVMLDGHRETLWFNGDSELDEELQAVIEVLGVID